APASRYMAARENGSAIALPSPAGPSTSPSACPLSPRRPYIGIRKSNRAAIERARKRGGPASPAAREKTAGMGKTIVIVGGGFAGVECARRLERHLSSDWDLVLFNEQNHITFTP